VIVGMGIELVDVARFASLLERYGDRLRERLFTERERAFAARGPRGAERLAARFAAKLATRRALRAGSLRWREIEVVREEGGPPALQLAGDAARCAQLAGVGKLALTLTHDSHFCVGQVVLESAR
jgi:holo-[acyl-carrier protein] synthase